MQNFAASIWEACLSSFGRTVIYQPAQGAPAMISGIFDAGHRLIDLGEAGISTVHPTLGVKLSAFEITPEPGDRLEVDEIGYEVSDVQPDGQGGALLILKRL